jgi:hypothetical protein
VRYFLVLFLCLPVLSYAAERDYVTKLCPRWGGQAEVILVDKTRVDCITKNHAIEFEFAKKWKEAIGQSLHYSLLTGKKPKIVMICEKQGDVRYVSRTINIIVAYKLPIELDTIECDF